MISLTVDDPDLEITKLDLDSTCAISSKNTLTSLLIL